MPLPADFPQPPKRPPASVALMAPDGSMARAWLNYFDAFERYLADVRAHLDTL